MRHLYIRHHEASVSVDDQVAMTARFGKRESVSTVDETGSGNEARDAMIATLAHGDHVVFATPTCFGDSLKDIQSALRDTLMRGASVLCVEPRHVIASTALPAIQFLEDVLSTKRREAGIARWNSVPHGPKGAPHVLVGEARAAAERDWKNLELTREAVALAHGVTERTLYRQFGPRERGKGSMLNQH